jgi:2-succinyl-5-enolpyruvyl-6-hydroxy-3-cyclohexene-1-carboxylate synthase
VARDVVRSLPPGAQLVLASSMPVRDVEWFAPRRSDITVHANRGANGIDGTISTSVGVALASAAPTVALVGDIAFLHDSNALITITDRGIDLTIVVVDNDGGGIFSFLPHLEPGDQFERLFGTPHGVPLEHLAAVHGLTTLKVEDASMIAPALQATMSTGGVWVVLARTDRTENVRFHAGITEEFTRRRS